MMDAAVHSNVMHTPTGWKGTVTAAPQDDLREVAWDLLGAPEGVQTPPSVVPVLLLETVESVEALYPHVSEFAAMFDRLLSAEASRSIAALDSDVYVARLHDSIEDSDVGLTMLDHLTAPPRSVESSIVSAFTHPREEFTPKQTMWDDPISMINKPFSKDENNDF